MKDPLPFSFESVLQVTAPADPGGGRLLALGDGPIERGADWCQTLQGDRHIGLISLDLMLVRRPAHCVLEAQHLLMTYVHRHSPSGLHWRDSRGAASELVPGALLLSQSQQEGLLELSAASFGEPCICVQVALDTGQMAEVAMLTGPDEARFCNSNEACVRVMSGRYRDHEASGPSALNFFDIDLAPLADLELPLDVQRVAIAVVATGTLQLDGAPIDAPCVIAFSGAAGPGRLATQTGASLLWIEWPRAPTT